MKLKVSAISIGKLRNNQFKDELPEFFELRNCMENNGWHKNESVFHHTLSVAEELEKVLKNLNNSMRSFLNQKVDRCSRKDLLFLGTLFHDIAKGDTLAHDGKFTSCPNHEKVGSIKVQGILERFDISEREKTLVVHMVKYHGEMHSLFDPKNKNFDKKYNQYKSAHSDIFLELLLLGLADTLGCQLEKNNPDEFKRRIDLYERMIGHYK